MKGYGKIIWVTLLCLVLMLTSCSGPGSKRDDQEEQEEEKIQIGMSFDSFVIERWQRDRDVFVSTAKELGASRMQTGRSRSRSGRSNTLSKWVWT